MSKPQDKLLDEKIDTALHPERNGLLLGKVAEGASHEHIIKKSIKDLITTECNKAVKRVWERVALETRANVCECGEKWADTDLGVLAEQELAKLNKESEKL